MESFGRSLLVLGGARSGKSRHAQARAEAIEGPLVYIATAQAFDDEMVARIAQHQNDRDSRWRTHEAPIALPEAIAAEGRNAAAILVDCLTLWASNVLLSGEDAEPHVAALVDAIAHCPCPIILVANEIGFGIVPDNALARQFRDLAGSINQRVGAAVTSAELIVAGFPMTLKHAN